ncbi:DegV family protein [[Eubacterium] hominis]|uniref:DegV family protein n=1 Tax=[Eubacterium] hominis TaxID=2764325 RepID=UPI003A4E30C3
MKTAFVTDSGCGKSVAQLQEVGIYSVPLQVSYEGKNFHDQEDITIDEVYQLMKDGKMLSTSLPALGKIEELFTKLKEEGYERIFAVPICSGLSGTINAMALCAQQLDLVFEYVDCHVTAVVQEYMIRLAKTMYESGNTMDHIKATLQRIIDTTDTLLLPNDLQHLKRGGRLTPLAATLGGLLKIKPILKINQETNGKIDVVDKVRTMHRAMDNVIEIMRQEHVDDSYMITVAHADDEVEAQIYMNKLKQAFPGATHQIIKLVSVVGVHTGRGCQAVQYFKMLKD